MPTAVGVDAALGQGDHGGRIHNTHSVLAVAVEVGSRDRRRGATVDVEPLVDDAVNRAVGDGDR